MNKISRYPLRPIYFIVCKYQIWTDVKNLSSDGALCVKSNIFVEVGFANFKIFSQGFIKIL